MTYVADKAGPLLSFDGVGMCFGAHAAIDGLTFEVAGGGVLAVIGPNGAGKTTLLRLLAGALEPTAGRIVWHAGTRPLVALVAQTVALYPFLTPRENCLAAGRMEGVRGATLRKRTEAAIAATRCGDVRDRLVGRLSGGYQRRAAIAAALMGDAPLVVLDEPTAGLDAASTSAMVEILGDLRSRGKTVVMSTHDFPFADATADSVLALRDGTVRAVGTPAGLRRRFFAARRHVEIVPGTLSPRQVDLMLAIGARPASTGRWSFFSEVDGEGRPFAMDDLRKAEVELREIRISIPGTAALFELLIAEQGAP